MHDFRGCAVPEGEYGYISKTPSTTVLQHLCNILKSIVTLYIVPVTIETLSLRYYTARHKLRKSHGDSAENMRDIIMLAFCLIFALEQRLDFYSICVD